MEGRWTNLSPEAPPGGGRVARWGSCRGSRERGGKRSLSELHKERGAGRFRSSRKKFASRTKIFPKPLRPAAGSDRGRGVSDVSQPPKSAPHSDLDGVHHDEKPNVETAIEAGQGTEDL